MPPCSRMNAPSCGVELVRGDARREQPADVRDRLGDERPRRRDLLDLARALADDHLAVTPSSASWIAANTSSTVCSPSTMTSIPATW